MKTIVILIVQLIMGPALLMAQPIIAFNEYYHVGDQIQMIDCDIAGMNAGATGAGRTWDFSSVNIGGSSAVMAVAKETTASFATSNLVITMPGGLKAHVSENNTDTYLNCTIDPTTGIKTYYDNCLTSRRPFTYLSNYIDSYRVNTPAATIRGTGHVVMTGDGYGTLKLPTGTYENVLRVRKYRLELDTSRVPAFAKYITTVSYLWFDALHHAPLLEIDSIAGSVGSTQRALYLSEPVAVKQMQLGDRKFSAWMDNNKVVVTGDFELNKVYEIIVVNIIGQTVLKEDFTTTGITERFEARGQMLPGVYMVSICPKDNTAYREVFKVIKTN